MTRIVLTGGPGAGKSIVSAAIAAAMPGRFVRVPEAATQVYSAMGTRWDRLDLPNRRDVQRKIYRHQVAQEQKYADDNPGKILLLDRGTIDGSVYWPDGPADYWRDLGTTREDELQRYDYVIWMQTCAAVGAYDGSASNACRFEDPAAAIESGERLAVEWGAHPHFVVIDAFPDMQDKIDRVLAVVREIAQHSPAE